MATTTLTSTESASLPRGPITVFVESREVGAEVRVEIDSDVAVRRRPGMLVVSSVPEPITVSVSSTNGAVFPRPAFVYVTVMSATGVSSESDRVVLPSVSVAGLQTLEVLTLHPVGADIAVTAKSADRLQFGPLGDAARVAARRLTGGPGLARDARHHVRVVVDDSASMMANAIDDRLACAIELLTGLAPGIGVNPQISPEFVGSPEAALHATPTTLPDLVDKHLRDRQLRTGLPLAGLPDVPGRSVTFLVTDGIPAEDDVLDESWHYVVLADESAAEALRRESAHDVTVVSASRARLLEDSALLDAVVHGLLASVLREESS